MKRTYVIGLSIFIVLLAFALLWAFNTTFRNLSKAPILPNNIIPTNSSESIVIGKNQTPLQALIEAEKALPGDSASGTVIQVSPGLDSQTFFTDIGPTAPQSLTSSLASNFMFGFYYGSDVWQPFMIFKITSYSQALAGLSKWEPTMTSDLSPLMSIVSSSTSEATAFQSTVIENVDVREAYTPEGTPVLLYALPDNQTIVITTSEPALRELLARLSPQRFPR